MTKQKMQEKIIELQAQVVRLIEENQCLNRITIVKESKSVTGDPSPYDFRIDWTQPWDTDSSTYTGCEVVYQNAWA